VASHDVEDARQSRHFGGMATPEAPALACRGSDMGRSGTAAPCGALRERWRPACVLTLCASLLAASTGCTAIGAGVGSAFPKYEAVYPASPEWLALRPGTEIAVDLVHAARVRQCAHTESGGLECTRPAASHRLTGRFLGTDPEHLWLRVDEGPLAVDLAEVERVSQVDGSYQVAGAVIGLVVDVAVLAAIVAAFPAIPAGAPH
jgi:hypothetical protein